MVTIRIEVDDPKHGLIQVTKLIPSVEADNAVPGRAWIIERYMNHACFEMWLAIKEKIK